MVGVGTPDVAVMLLAVVMVDDVLVAVRDGVPDVRSSSPLLRVIFDE